MTDEAIPVPMLDLTAQYRAIRDEVLPRLAEVLETQLVCQGPACGQLEAQMAAYCGVPHAVAVSSGTDALLAGMMARDYEPGDEVITTPFSFFATAGTIWRRGLTPVFADIDPDTFNLDPAAAAAAITPRTRAVMPVHLFGQMADMGRFADLTRRHNLDLIEDAAQAVGSTYRGEHPGVRSTFAALSFYPTKNLGGAGDGGMVLTPDPELADRVARLRNHGTRATYLHERVGGNFRLATLNAAYLLVKLRHLDRYLAARRAHAARYDHAFADLDGLTPPRVCGHACHAWNQYVVRTPDRDALKQHLDRHNIGNAIYYPLCLHEQPCFASLGLRRGMFPHAERAATEVLALPIFPEMTESQANRVIAAVRNRGRVSSAPLYKHVG